jgi:SAM-dependent methyltransferase
MRVSRDFERIYREAADPWGIANADSERYELYRRLVLEHARLRGPLLDIGCGLGAFVARFRGEFASLHGVEISAQAIARGRRRFPFVDFRRGSAGELARALPQAGRFDAIVYSDVIYYLRERDRRRSLRWIAEHLPPDGLALIAAWTPGGKYLDDAEFRRLVELDFAIERSVSLTSDHTVFICRPRRVLCALTVDYETWQPLPEGKMIDWERDIMRSTARLLDVFDAQGAVLTIMAEMGEYLWLVENLPEVARRMEEQWRDAVRRGHDVQLHLHPAWLPELGAHHDGDTWRWDPAYARAHDYPGDLTAVIARCRRALESAIRPALPEYRVTSFRAGAYEAQPFVRLHDALAANGIECDSSVLPGDSRPDRHYDYGLAYSAHQPYFAGRFDPQLKAPPAERSLVELPAFSIERRLRWTFDDGEGSRFAWRLLAARRRERRTPTIEALRRRRRLGAALNHGYQLVRRRRWDVNRLLPRAVAYATTTYAPERLVEHEYYVMVAHTKATLDLDAIANGLRRLRAEGIELRSLSELAQLARRELDRSSSSSRAADDDAE